jgi:hypothetical protein
LLLTLIRWAGGDDQWNSVGIGDHVPLTAIFAAIRRVRARVVPPFTARTLAQSITSRSKFSNPCSPSNWTICPWAFLHTPAVVHSWNRRQQVDPEPHAISAGSDCQRIPSRRTKRIPTKQLRSDTRGRPPFGEDRCFGKCGAIASQSSSVRSAGIRDLHVSLTKKRSVG